MRSSVIAIGGARRDRTDDLLLAKQALSQLSYGPFYDCAPCDVVARRLNTACYLSMRTAGQPFLFQKEVLQIVERT